MSASAFTVALVRCRQRCVQIRHAGEHSGAGGGVLGASCGLPVAVIADDVVDASAGRGGVGCVMASAGDNGNVVNAVEAEKYILFQMDQLGAGNAHHAFEELCTRVAQRRVSSNILLVTGPVSAGGDQARDAESYFTRLPAEIPGATGFIGAAATYPVGVACTVQKSKLEAKFKADLKTICEKGQPVAHVAFFCVQPVSAAKQHAWQEHAQNIYGVTADVFDGPKLAMLLAQRDLVWVAEEYLQLPAAMIPDDAGEDALPDWYSHDLSVLRGAERPLQSAGDLATVRGGLRHATFHDEARGDLPEWLGYAQQLASRVNDAADGLGADISARGKYEIVVATLRGLNRFDGVEHLAFEFFEHAARSDSVAILDDAGVLLMYCTGAWARHLGALGADDLLRHATVLREHADELIGRVDPTTHPTAYAQLLAVAAKLALHPDWPNTDRPDAEALLNPQQTSQALKAARDAGRLPHIPAAAVEHLNLTAALDRLETFARHLPNAPGLPVESLCDVFELLTPVLAQDHRYAKVRDALDQAIADVEGQSAVAARCRSRAIALFKSGQPLTALREFHEAKVNWWHGDTMRGSLLAMRFIARIYNDLNLPHAAKQYALAAATVALATGRTDLGDLVPGAFVEASDYMYRAGAWLDVTAMSSITRLAHAHYAEHAFDFGTHPDLARLESNQAMVLLAAQVHRPALVAWIEQEFARTAFDQDIVPMADYVREAFPASEAELVRRCDEQLAGRPFSDTGLRRTLTFAALGTSWTLTCTNDRLSVLACERLAATVQILMADLALGDPVFVHGDVTVEVSVQTPLDKSQPVRFRPDNDGVTCTIYLTPHSASAGMETIQFQLVTKVVYLLSHLSLLPHEAFMEQLDSSLEQGLLHKVTSGRPYDETADLFGAEHYDSVAGLPSSRLQGPEQVASASRLPAPDDAGARYNRDEAVARCAERYEYLPTLMTQTLPRVLADASILVVLRQLRAEGWLDWQLLLAVHNLAMNVRLRREGVDVTTPTPENQSQLTAFARKPETGASEPIPLAFFSDQALRTQLNIGLLTALTQFGLQSHEGTPAFASILRVLRDRFGFRSDDAPHPGLFNV